MACDFHTHKKKSPVTALRSVRHWEEGLCSLEKHPWDLPAEFEFCPEKFSAELAGFCALGEVGLDRLRGVDISIQIEYLKKCLAAAQDMNKPVVFHIVRAWEEFFALIKPYKLKMMVHGFRGSRELLQELWKRGIVVSFHKSVTEREDIISCLSEKVRFGFESDDDEECDVVKIIAGVADKCKWQGIEQFSDTVFQEFVNG